MTALVLRFIHIPKTGGLSIQKSLASQPNIAKHKGHQPVAKQVKDLHRYVYFSCVRNPYTRAVSIYNFYRTQRDIVPRDMTFRDFAVGDLQDATSRVHTEHGSPAKPCSYFLSIGGSLVVRELLYFETLEQDFRRLCRKYEMNARLLHRHRFEYANKNDVQAYYCPDTIRAVTSAYREDFDNFGYPTDLEKAYNPPASVELSYGGKPLRTGAAHVEVSNWNTKPAPGAA